MGIFIQSVGGFAPEKIVTNDDLAVTLETSDEWIYSHTGIKRRHIADDDVFASDLGIIAAKSALDNGNIDPESIDMIVLATSTPDYFAYPNTASLVQHSIGAVNAGAVDISAACSGFIYALEIARGMILANTAGKVLVVGAETNSKILNWKDRNTCVLFGDAAGAAVLSKTDNNESDIIKTILKAEGDGAHALMVKAGGCRHAVDSPGITEEDRYVSMDGRKVYNFAVRANTELIQNLLDSQNMKASDLAYIIPHQANIRIIQAAAKRLGLPDDLFFSNMHEYANTSAASIPLALNDMINRNLLKRGDNLLLLGFGAGLTYGGTFLRW